ncbi:uncharacterized protein LOC115887348 [Sitophilus oryzae]|uniref:Uncharacterized protein LOC115887348 n=1 Tax=Sitophilus oryzae TaxID=7048 RepID=A0A6J2YH75_SITOR|nr:uncharacterized protein LOC115887348 [Sitophilus oryzae]
MTANHLIIILAVVCALSTKASAFWFNAEEPQTSKPRVLYQAPDYYRQYVPPPLPYVPLQVPLPAHLAPATVQNVQLVPCLCPVSQEYSYDSDLISRKAQFVQQPSPIPQQKRRR